MEKAENCNRQEADRVYTVRLEGLEFRANHGCREDEKLNGNTFRVDFSGEFRSCAGATDTLEDTVNYGAVYRVIESVMMGERRNLLESLACDIVDKVRCAFGEFTWISVSVGKKNPPVAGPCDWSWISTEWKSDQD